MISIDPVAVLKSRRSWPMVFLAGGSWVAYMLFAPAEPMEILSTYQLLLAWGVVTIFSAAWLVIDANVSAGVERKGTRGRGSSHKIKPSLHFAWFLGACGVALTVLGLRLRSPVELPEDVLIISVLEFTPISESYREQAANYSDRIYTLLRTQTRNSSIRVQRVPVGIPLLGDEKARSDAAVAVGRRRDSPAHVVLWGDFVLDGDTMTVRPRLSVVQGQRFHGLEYVEMGTFLSWSPDYLIFKQSSAREIASFIPVVLGWAYLRRGEAQRAIQILSPPPSDDGKLLLATGYQMRFAMADDPLTSPGIEDLYRALALYESISVPPLWSHAPDQLPWAVAQAAYRRADVLKLIAGHTKDPEERAQLLRRAVDALETLNNLLSDQSMERDRAFVLLDLASTLGFYSEHLHASRDSLLRRSAQLINEAEQLEPGFRIPPTSYELAGYRASIDWFLAAEDRSSTGSKMLADALATALAASEGTSPVHVEAQALWFNIARISEELGRRAENQEGRAAYYNLALTYYRRVYESTIATGGTLFELRRDEAVFDSARARLEPQLLIR